MGERMYSEFLNFLYNYELQQDDPNYEAYTTGVEDLGQVIKYYIN